MVCQVKINGLEHPKAHIRETVVMVTPNMLQATCNEVDYRLDMCHATMAAHIEIYGESYIHRNNFDSFIL
jgi:hypothetical protein